MDVDSISRGCINFLCLAYFSIQFSEFGHTGHIVPENGGFTCGIHDGLRVLSTDADLSSLTLALRTVPAISKRLRRLEVSLHWDR